MSRSFSLPRILAKLALPVCALALIAGCGSSDDGPTTFDEEGFGITFELPGDFERTKDVTVTQSAGEAEETVAFAQSKENAIFVQRYSLNRAVTEKDAEAVRKELDGVIGQLSGGKANGERVDAGGLLAFRYEIEDLSTPEDGRSTIVAMFDGKTEYFLNCQSVPDGRDEVDEACDTAIETLEQKEA